jgi:hypothetical protein
MDRIHKPPQPPEEGDGQVAGEIPTFSGGTNGLKLGVTTPDSIPLIDPGNPGLGTQTSTAGVFTTGLSYGPGTVFSTRATFIRPIGPFDGKAWSVALNARTGDKNDRWTDDRLNVTFKFKNSGATLNVYEEDRVQGSVAVPTPVYNSIVSNSSPQPFTLELLVDRVTGHGVAILTATAAAPQKLPFSLWKFRAEDGPKIEAVGPSLANCCMAGTTVSVEVIDFQILQTFSERP